MVSVYVVEVGVPLDGLSIVAVEVPLVSLSGNSKSTYVWSKSSSSWSTSLSSIVVEAVGVHL